MVNKKKLVIFSDFDGTITERDVIIMIMEKFAPSKWVEIKDKILYNRTITLKNGVEMLFGLLESSKKDEIIAYAKNEAKIRSGFKEFLNFCSHENIEFNVLSGGLDFFIEPVLEEYKSKLKIFCNSGDFNSEKIRIKYSYLPLQCSLCGDCGCCKIEIIEKHEKEQFIRVLIGDSLTDLAPSRVVDVVFARGDLIKYLKQEKISYIPFNDFYEVKEKLAQKYLTRK